MRLTTTQFSRLSFVGMLLMLAVASCFNMRTMDDGLYAGSLERYAPPLTWIFWLAFTIKLFLPGYKLYRPAWPIICYGVFLLWTLIPTVLSSQKGMAYNLIWLNLPFVVLLMSYNEIRNHGGHKWYNMVFAVMVVMFVIQFARILTMILSLTDTAHLAVAYFSMYILPLALLCESRLVKVALIIAVIVAIMTSMKRAGVVALILALLAYMVVSQYVADKLTPRHILYGSFAVVGMGVLFFVLGSMGEETLWERFENIGNDNGSGRTVVWAVTMKMISELSMASLLVGEGYNAVLANSPLSFSAHNDFLEILYDYGIIGFVLYLFAIASVIWYALKMVLQKSPYAPNMVMMLVIYLILSLISHIAIYFWMSIVMLTFAYLIGNYERDASNK